jgi:hypothetical protein
MVQYLVAIYPPDEHEPFGADEAMGREIDVLNETMMVAGVRVFVGGLQPPGSAKSIRVRPGGGLVVTDGPHLKTKEQLGGFWVLETVDFEAALAWGRRAAMACRAAVEVRPFYPPPHPLSEDRWRHVLGRALGT